jgi:hypothetical protein
VGTSRIRTGVGIRPGGRNQTADQGKEGENFKIAAFWDVASCSLVAPSIRVMSVEAESFSETQSRIHPHRRENMTFHTEKYSETGTGLI